MRETQGKVVIAVRLDEAMLASTLSTRLGAGPLRPDRADLVIESLVAWEDLLHVWYLNKTSKLAMAREEISVYTHLCFPLLLLFLLLGAIIAVLRFAAFLVFIFLILAGFLYCGINE